MAISAEQLLQPSPEAPPPDAMAPAQPEGSINPAAALETLPADVLDIPAVFAVSKGQPAAVSAPNPTDDPAIKVLTKNAQALVAAGFGLYESRDGKNRVLYNSALIDVGSLLDADVQGKLAEVAPPFSSIQAPGASSALPGATGAAPSPMSQPASAVQTELATQRTNNINPGSPTSGPKPGAGRLLNALLTPAV